MLKSAWNWIRDSSVVNEPLGKPGHTAPWTVTACLFPYFVGELHKWGLWEIYMTKLTTGSGDGAPLSIGAPAGEYYFSGAFEKKSGFVFVRGCVKECSGNGHLTP
jgi:hypothetical protein